MTAIYFDGVLALTCGGGSYIQGAKVLVPHEEPTMNQIVKAIKAAGYISFKLPTMRRLVSI